MTCPRCQHDTPAAAKFCGQCGVELAGDARFCTACGHRVGAPPADVVRQLVAGKDFGFSDRGEATLRGIEHPVRTWELLW